MPNPTTAEEWADAVLKGAMIPGGVEVVAAYRARVSQAIKGYAAQQTAALRAEVERLTKITKLQAAALDVWKRAHPHEMSPIESPDWIALVAVAKVAEEFTRPRESGSHPGGGGDPAARERLHALQVALAHPAAQRAVKK